MYNDRLRDAVGTPSDGTEAPLSRGAAAPLGEGVTAWGGGEGEGLPHSHGHVHLDMHMWTCTCGHVRTGEAVGASLLWLLPTSPATAPHMPCSCTMLIHGVDMRLARAP